MSKDRERGEAATAPAGTEPASAPASEPPREDLPDPAPGPAVPAIDLVTEPFPELVSELVSVQGLGAVVDELQAQVARLQEEVRTLEAGMETREMIGNACGLAAAWLSISTVQAWEIVRIMSNLTNMRAREVARLLVASANNSLVNVEDHEAARRIADAWAPPPNASRGAV